MKKRALSLILAAVMLATLSLFSVSAEGTSATVGITKTTLPESYVTEKSVNCFPAEANTYRSARDTGVGVNPEYYATSSADVTTLELVGGTKEASGTATFTINDASGLYAMYWYFKALPSTDTKYLAFDIDTTGMTGGEYYHFAIQKGQANWGYYEFIPESEYYFKPVDGEKEKRKVSINSGHDSFWVAPNEKGTVYIPETSLKNSVNNNAAVDFESAITSGDAWLMDDGSKTLGLIIENKIADEAANGDKIVFSNLRWITEKPVSSTVSYNAEYLVNDFSTSETGNHVFNAVPTRWDNWTNVPTGKAFDSSFDAVKFDIDYSQFLGNECYMNLRYSFKRMVEEVETAYSCHVVSTVYLIAENGYVYTQTPNTGWNNNIVLPSGFKGSVVIPFASFDNSEVLYTQDAYNYNITIQAYGTDAESTITATIDNVGFMAEYDADDIIAVRKNILGLGDAAVDFNGDGNIDILDLIRVKKFFI